MMKRGQIWLILGLALPACTASAQATFQVAIGGALSDQARSIRATADGGYIIAGWTASYGAGGNDVMLVKTDEVGALMWASTFGGNQGDWGYSVQQTADNGFILTGGTASFGNGNIDMLLLRADINGTLMWEKTIGGNNSDDARSVRQTFDGGFVLAGFTYTYGAGNADFYLVKTDSDGSIEWTSVFGGNSQDDAYSIEQTADSGYVVVGRTVSYGSGSYDIYMAKLSNSGVLQWQSAIGSNKVDEGYSIKQTADNGYIITGQTNGMSGGVSTEAFLMKLSSSGSLAWTTTYGKVGFSIDEGYDVIQTADNGYILAGRTLNSGAFSYDIYFLKTDSEGELMWVRGFGENGQEAGYSVDLTQDGGYIVGGNTFGFGSGGYDYYMVKIDSLGNCACYQNPVTPVKTDVFPSVITGAIVSSGGVTTSPNFLVSAVPSVTTICLILPVELVAFTGSNVDNREVKLQWTTASENNLDYFEVERSFDGAWFEPTGRVRSTCSGQAFKDYAFTDENPARGRNYYRLKQVYRDGSSEYSFVISVTLETEAPALRVYPNPSTGEDVQVELTGFDGEEVLVVLYNPMGEIVYSKVLLRVNGIITAVDPQNRLTPGVYLVVGSSRDEILQQRLVVK